jgi:hypothetical protein
MAEVTKTGVPSLSTPYPSPEHRLTIIAGEAIAAGDACYIRNDGLAMKATGAAAAPAAKVFGFALGAADLNGPVTIAHGVNIGYGPKVAGTPVNEGTELFLSGTVAGGLADAASTGGTVPIAVVIDDSRIFAKGNY